VRYTKVEKVMVLLILIGVDGIVVDTIEVKSKMLAEIVFPLPLGYSSGSGEVGE
jgi:hypothetical protein